MNLNFENIGGYAVPRAEGTPEELAAFMAALQEQSQKHIAIGKKGQRTEILMKAKELVETKDQKEALEKLQSGDWIAVNAIYKGEDIYLCLIRIS